MTIDNIYLCEFFKQNINNAVGLILIKNKDGEVGADFKPASHDKESIMRYLKRLKMVLSVAEQIEDTLVFNKNTPYAIVDEHRLFHEKSVAMFDRYKNYVGLRPAKVCDIYVYAVAGLDVLNSCNIEDIKSDVKNAFDEYNNLCKNYWDNHNE